MRCAGFDLRCYRCDGTCLARVSAPGRARDLPTVELPPGDTPTLLTDDAHHRPRSGVGIPSLLSASAIAAQLRPAVRSAAIRSRTQSDTGVPRCLTCRTPRRVLSAAVSTATAIRRAASHGSSERAAQSRSATSTEGGRRSCSRHCTELADVPMVAARASRERPLSRRAATSMPPRPTGRGAQRGERVDAMPHSILRGTIRMQDSLSAFDSKGECGTYPLPDDGPRWETRIMPRPWDPPAPMTPGVRGRAGV